MIVASMATLSSRVKLLERTVASLLPQVDALCVYLNGHRQLPDCLKHPKVLHAIMSHEAGWRGAEAKLWFWDEDEFKAAPRWTKNDIALIVDDDIIYPDDYVLKMVAGLERHPGCVVSVHGSVAQLPFESYGSSRMVAGCRDGIPCDARVHVPGSGTMAFRFGDLPISLRRDFVWSHSVDPNVARFCAERGIECWVVARPEFWLNPLVIPPDSTSIFRQRVGGGNDTVETKILQGAELSPLPEPPDGFRQRVQRPVVRRGARPPKPRDVKKNTNSMLPAEVFDWLKPHLAGMEAGYVVELGSGHGTQHLLECLPSGVGLVSVEHLPDFVGLIHGTRYIYAPLVKGWYSEKALCALPPKDTIRALIIDGPPKTGRAGVLDHLHLFPEAVPILIDDVHRTEEQVLVTELERRRGLGERAEQHLTVDGRAFATMGWSQIEERLSRWESPPEALNAESLL